MCYEGIRGRENVLFTDGNVTTVIQDVLLTHTPGAVAEKLVSLMCHVR